MEILRMKPQRKEIKQVIHGVALKYIAFEIDLEIAKFHLLCRYYVMYSSVIIRLDDHTDSYQ